MMEESNFKRIKKDMHKKLIGYLTCNVTRAVRGRHKNMCYINCMWFP